MQKERNEWNGWAEEEDGDVRRWGKEEDIADQAQVRGRERERESE